MESTHATHEHQEIRQTTEERIHAFEDLRDRAELLLRERPYLLPIGTGVLGFGIGVLCGSKLSRLILLTAAGALLSERARTDVLQAGRELLHDIKQRLEDERRESESEPAI